MTPEQAISMYRRRMRPFETVSIRRYVGTGPTRTHSDWTVAARVVGYQPEELTGAIQQGDRRVIILYEDLAKMGFPFPIENGSNWKLVVRGKELQIKVIDDSTRRLGGVLIAYDIQAGG
jgi:hypothetical protein